MLQTAFAPGRVELLGNHTDYNEGYVLSAAIDRGVTMHGDHTANGLIHLRSNTVERSVSVPLGNFERQAGETWANYPLGVVRSLADAGYAVGSFSAEISSDVPTGAGLSSSAALEVATATLLAKIFDFDLAPMEKAKLCRRAENDFVGVNCGLLDQVSSVFGRRDHIIFLDCRRETVETIPFSPDLCLLVINSGVEHRLIGGEYNERRASCFAAAERLGEAALRDVTSAQLDRAKDKLPALLWRRAAHIVGENERVRAGIDLLRNHDSEAFGELMFTSHESSRTFFENSTPELDLLVALARPLPGVLGSRLTGGGFGGSTVSLVQRSASAEIGENIRQAYHNQTGHHAEVLQCAPGNGAS